MLKTPLIATVPLTALIVGSRAELAPKKWLKYRTPARVSINFKKASWGAAKKFMHREVYARNSVYLSRKRA